MTNVSNKETQARLNSLYRVAVSLTGDPDEALRLLETTAGHVRDHSDLAKLGAAERFSRAVSVMVALHSEQRAGGEPATGARSGRAALTDPERMELLRPILERHIALAWALLEENQRLVLTLSDVEELGAERVAAALGTGVPAAEERVEASREVLVEALREAMSPPERAFSDWALSLPLLREVLQQHVQEKLEPVPAELHSTLGKKLKRVLQPAPSPAQPRRAETSAPANSRRGAPSRLARLGTVLRYGLAAAVVVVVIGVIGYLAAQYFEEAPETNLITLSAEQAPQITPGIQTDQLDEAERYIYEQSDTRLILPSIDRAVLVGASLTRLAPGVEVPAFLYEEHTGDELALYAYNYRLLDRHGDRLHLASDVLRQIEDDTHYDIHDLGDRQVLIWRHRSVIYVAVTSGEASELRDRIIMPS